jgi:hypothetical protein
MIVTWSPLAFVRVYWSMGMLDAVVPYRLFSTEAPLFAPISGEAVRQKARARRGGHAGEEARELHDIYLSKWLLIARLSC